MEERKPYRPPRRGRPIRNIARAVMRGHDFAGLGAKLGEAVGVP
jgi:hypothetical protein